MCRKTEDSMIGIPHTTAALWLPDGLRGSQTSSDRRTSKPLFPWADHGRAVSSVFYLQLSDREAPCTSQAPAAGLSQAAWMSTMSQIPAWWPPLPPFGTPSRASNSRPSKPDQSRGVQGATCAADHDTQGASIASPMTPCPGLQLPAPDPFAPLHPRGGRLTPHPTDPYDQQNQGWRGPACEGVPLRGGRGPRGGSALSFLGSPL